MYIEKERSALRDPARRVKFLYVNFTTCLYVPVGTVSLAFFLVMILSSSFFASSFVNRAHSAALVNNHWVVCSSRTHTHIHQILWIMDGEEHSLFLSNSDLRSTLSSARNRPALLGGYSPAYSTTMNPTEAQRPRKPPSSARLGSASSGGLTPRWGRPHARELETRLPPSPPHPKEPRRLLNICSAQHKSPAKCSPPQAPEEPGLLDFSAPVLQLPSSLEPGTATTRCQRSSPPLESPTRKLSPSERRRRSPRRGNRQHPPLQQPPSTAQPPPVFSPPSSSSEARRIMDKLRDGVSSLCLSADSVIANLNDWDASHRNAEAAARKTVLAEFEKDHRAANSFGDLPTCATEALETVLASLLTATGNPSDEALASSLLQNINRRNPPAPVRGAASGVFLADPTKSTQSTGAAAGQTHSSGLVPMPTITAASGTFTAPKNARPFQLSVEKSLGEHGLGPVDTAPELFDIADAQMHLQTVLQVTRSLSLAEDIGVRPAARRSSNVSYLHAPPPPPNESGATAIMFDAVRTAAKQAAMHLHNAADAFKLQRLEIAALQEQQRRQNAASLFTSNSGGRNPRQTPRARPESGGKGEEDNGDVDEYLLLVTFDANHLFGIELSPRQSAALCSLFYRFVHGVVERCDTARVVKETGNDTTGCGITSSCCYLLSFGDPAETLCFERGMQHFACYLPWRLTAASRGQLPTRKTSGSPSTLLQERLVEDVPPWGQHTLGSPKRNLVAAGPGGAPALCLGRLTSLHQPEHGAHEADSSPFHEPSLPSPIQQPAGPLTRDERANLVQVMAKVEDAFRLMAIREIQTCLSFCRREKRSASQKRQVVLKEGQQRSSESVSAATTSLATEPGSPRGRSVSPDPTSPVAKQRRQSSSREETDAAGHQDDATMDSTVDELQHIEERLLMDMTKKQISAGDQPVWAVRGPLLRCALHYGNAVAAVRRDRFRACNPLLEVVATLAARCRGGTSVMSLDAKVALHRYLAALDADVYHVDNAADAATMAPAHSQHRAATHLWKELRMPVHYELCWSNQIARYTHLAAATGAAAGTDATASVLLRNNVAHFGYHADWWLLQSSPLLTLARGQYTCSTSTTQTDGASGSGGNHTQHGSPHRSSKKGQQVSPLRQKSSSRVFGMDESEKDAPPHATDDALMTAQSTVVVPPTAVADRRPSQSKRGSVASERGGATAVALTPVASVQRPSGGGRRKSSGAATTKLNSSHSSLHRASMAVAMSSESRETGVQSHRDLEDNELRVSTRMLLEACRWMFEWIEGTMEEDEIVMELFGLLGRNVAYSSDSSGGQQAHAAAQSLLTPSGHTVPAWGDLTTLAEQLVQRYQSWPFGDDALASRAAVALQFCTMRDVLREVNLYRRRRSSAASPSAAAAAAAAANARRASATASTPHSVAPAPKKTWLDAKNQVVANPTAALAGGQRPVIGAIIGRQSPTVVTSPSTTGAGPCTPTGSRETPAGSRETPAGSRSATKHDDTPSHSPTGRGTAKFPKPLKHEQTTTNPVDDVMSEIPVGPFLKGPF